MESLIYFLLWAALIDLMMRFGCGAHVFGHRHGDSRAPRADQGGPGRLRWEAPATAHDPVCGVTMSTDNAKSAVHDGDVFYFCSTECREKFEAAPHAYIGTPTNRQPKSERRHG
jgi:YHS domain-containing protein